MVDSTRTGVSGDGDIVFFESPKEVQDGADLGLGGYPLGSQALTEASIKTAHRMGDNSGVVPAVPESGAVVFDFRKNKKTIPTEKDGPVVGEADLVASMEVQEAVAPGGEAILDESTVEKIGIEDGQVWKNSKGEVFTVQIEESDTILFPRLTFVDGERKGEEISFVASDFVEFVRDGGFVLIDDVPENEKKIPVRAEQEVPAFVEQEMPKEPNPIMRSTFAALEKAQTLAKEKDDAEMLAYLKEVQELLARLAGKTKFDSADIGTLGETRKKLDTYLESVVDKKEGEVQPESVGELKVAEDIKVLEQEIEQEIDEVDKMIKSHQRTLHMRAVNDWVTEEEWTKMAAVLDRAKADRDAVINLTNEDGHEQEALSRLKQIKESLDISLLQVKVLPESEEDAADVKVSAVEKKGKQEKRLKEKPGKKTGQKKVAEAVLEQGNEDFIYERLEKSIEKIPVYHTIYGAIGITLDKMPAGVIEKKDQFEEHIIKAIEINFNHSIDEIGDRFGWSADEKRIFLDKLAKKALRELEIKGA
jgi:hypothetical protein